MGRGERTVGRTDRPLPKNTLWGSYLTSSIKLRQAGFADCIDPEDMFVEWLQEMQRVAVMPPARAKL